MQRPYDFDDIKKRRDQGELWRDIAVSYGRSKQAIEQATKRHFAPKPGKVDKLAVKLAAVARAEARREVTP